MSLNYRPGLNRALDLLDEYSEERDPSEILTEFRSRLMGELDDHLPSLKEVQDWTHRLLYQNYGQVDIKEMERRAPLELGMQVEVTDSGEEDELKTPKWFQVALKCKRRTVNMRLERTNIAPRGQLNLAGRIRYQLAAINVEG